MSHAANGACSGGTGIVGCANSAGRPSLTVIHDEDAPDWYWVQSRSRADVLHLVDIAYQDEPWRTPYPACSCEAFMINLYTMGKPCEHIRAVRKWRKKNETNVA